MTPFADGCRYNLYELCVRLTEARKILGLRTAYSELRVNSFEGGAWQGVD